MYSRGPGASAQITGGSISQNRAADDGGGIYSRQGRLVLEGVEVTGNTAGSDSFGGGILSRDSPVTITGGSVTLNEAGSGGGTSQF